MLSKRAFLRFLGIAPMSAAATVLPIEVHPKNFSIIDELVPREGDPPSLINKKARLWMAYENGWRPLNKTQLWSNARA